MMLQIALGLIMMMVGLLVKAEKSEKTLFEIRLNGANPIGTYYESWSDPDYIELDSIKLPINIVYISLVNQEIIFNRRNWT